jgi:hypothetical protein
MHRDSSEKPKLAICRGDDIERHGGSSCMHSQFNLRFHASRSNMRRHNKTLHYYKSLYQRAVIYCSNCTLLLSRCYSRISLSLPCSTVPAGPLISPCYNTVFKINKFYCISTSYISSDEINKPETDTGGPPPTCMNVATTIYSGHRRPSPPSAHVTAILITFIRGLIMHPIHCLIKS